MRVTSMLAEFIGKSRFEDCPPAAVDAARRAITDCLGVMLAGSTEPAARIVQTVAQAEGGTPLCTIVGTGRRTGGVWAALANGTAAHALDFDDTNFAMMGHPSAPVLAAALAAGELGLATGQDLVHAFLLGFEVETTVAEVINPAHYEHGWHATCTLGTLGAAAAASRLLGLDIAQTATALAVAASQASGLKENFGTMTKPFHAGHAARSGVLAALLAREGWTASEQAIEGPQGYLHAFSAGRRELGRARDARRAVEDHDHGRGRQALSVLRLHALDHRRRARAPPHACAPALADRLGRHRREPGGAEHPDPPDPKNGLEAKFSGEFSAAAALIDGRVGIATFGDGKVRDPEVRALMGRVTMVVDPEIPGELERHMWTRVTIRLADGRTLSIGPRQVPGHPGHPLTPAALEEKFAECAGLVLPADRVGALAEMLRRLDACPDLRSLTAVLGP